MGLLHSYSPVMRQLATILGLPKYTTAFNLRVTVGEHALVDATIQVTYIPDHKPFDEPVTQQFRLEPL